MKKVFIYPHYANPYQTMLYQAMEKDNKIVVSYFDDLYLNKHRYLDPILYPIPLLLNRLKGYKTFHIHWQNFAFKTPVSVINKPLSFLYTIFFLFFLKVFRYKIVWTIHNLVPHEPVTSNDLLITRILCKWSDVKIANSQETINKLKSMRLNTTKTIVIPLGNFIGYYKNSVTIKKAKEKLEIKENEFVVLYFGYS